MTASHGTGPARYVSAAEQRRARETQHCTEDRDADGAGGAAAAGERVRLPNYSRTVRQKESEVKMRNEAASVGARDDRAQCMGAELAADKARWLDGRG